MAVSGPPEHLQKGKHPRPTFLLAHIPNYYVSEVLLLILRRFFFSIDSLGWVESEPFHYTCVHTRARPIQVTPFSVHHQPTDVTHHSVRSVGICVTEHCSKSMSCFSLALQHCLSTRESALTVSLLTASFLPFEIRLTSAAVHFKKEKEKKDLSPDLEGGCFTRFGAGPWHLHLTS